jgi:hypothetical protein
MFALKNTNRIAELVERDAWLDLFRAAPSHVRTELGMACDMVAGMGLLGCQAIPITEVNRAMAVGVETSPSRKDMEDVTGWLDAHAASWALQIAPNVEATDVRAYLTEAAMVETGSGWAKFTGMNATPPAQIDNGSIEIEVVDGSRALLFGNAVTEGFGLPSICGEWFAALAERPSWQCFLARVDGQAAGGGAMFARDGAAWFGIEATVSTYRQRGVQRGIIAAQLAAAAGATVLTCETARPANRSDAGFSSYRNQERAGLTHAYTRPNFKRTS